VKQPFFSFRSPLGERFDLYKICWDGGKNDETLSIVSGLHGDQLNGLSVLSRLGRFFREIEEGREPDYKILGKVRLFPVTNFLALQGGSRHWSFDHLDLDLAFPGNRQGELYDRLCRSIFEETVESTHALLLHHPLDHDTTFPHTQLYRPDRRLRRMARSLGLEVVRELRDSPTLPLQLVYQWSESGVPSAILTGGPNHSVDPDLCGRLFSHIVNFMLSAGLIAHESGKGKKFEVNFFSPENEAAVLSGRGGWFVPEVKAGESVCRDQKLGEIRDIYSGETLEELTTPEDGFLVRLRHYPVVYEKEPVATVLVEKKRRWPWPF